jgi:Uma2 family endonuclease
VIFTERPREAVPSQLPLAVIEIVSPDDRLDDILSKLNDYKARGVPHVWLVDPSLRQGFVFEQESLHSVTTFSMPEFDIQLSLNDILS